MGSEACRSDRFETRLIACDRDMGSVQSRGRHLDSQIAREDLTVPLAKLVVDRDLSQSARWCAPSPHFATIDLVLEFSSSLAGKVLRFGQQMILEHST